MKYYNPPITESILDDLLSISDISEFESRVEEVRDELIEGTPEVSLSDLNTLKQAVAKLDLLRLQGVARLLGPLLEKEFYSQEAASIIKELLRHPEAEVRYAALEAISFALGEVPIGEEMLTFAKNSLKNEESPFVREYLESL